MARSESYRRQKRVGHPRTQGRDCYGRYKRVHPPIPSADEWDDDPYYDHGYDYDDDWYQVCTRCFDELDHCECPQFPEYQSEPLTQSIVDVLRVNIQQCPTCKQWMTGRISRRIQAFHDAKYCASLWSVLKAG